MTPSGTTPEVGYVLRRPALLDVQAAESRNTPALTDELLELREALEKEIAERDREVAARNGPPSVGSGDALPAIDVASRMRSAIRTAFDYFRFSNGVRGQ